MPTAQPLSPQDTCLRLPPVRLSAAHSPRSAILTPAAVLLLLVLGLTCMNRALIHPLRNYLLDFRSYYASGLALRAGLNPYNTAAVKSFVQLPGRQSVPPYVYPPPTLALCALASYLPYPSAQTPWLLLQFALAGAAFVLTLRRLRRPWYSQAAALTGVVFLLSRPFSELFRWGQWDMLPLALIAGGLLALDRPRALLGGTLLGLAAVAKVTPIALVAILLLRREKRAALAAIATIAAAVALTLLTLPAGLWASWRHNLAVLPADVSPQYFSLRGFLLTGFSSYHHRGVLSTPWLDLGPQAPLALSMAIAALAAGGLGLWLWRRRGQLSTAESPACAIPVLLRISPLTWTHHAVLLLIPLALATVRAFHAVTGSVFQICGLMVVAGLLLSAPLSEHELQVPQWLEHLIAPTVLYANVALAVLLFRQFSPRAHAVCTPAAPKFVPATL